MGIAVDAISFDCHDWRLVSAFWRELLAYWDDPDAASYSDPEAGIMIIGPDGTTPLVFIPVPERKSIKNRIHFELRPSSDSIRDAEVERALTLGARIADDRREPSGLGWVVMADPEGNEFCVGRGAQERS
ncbi:VOC family protein [Williamsia sterculiae]|uniref:Glyoxalase-like domain-containing protein n=1 Tax=Williamsia sterculiae TaxID=1344003 RepID=A0A1N7HDU0_9NOCA|nr:VOC family protein [Williamsia sterculiae]SIS23035.1 hypothetical protein SAMN05445060_4037 [Williamsia sterculiae]